ncbi:MAG: GNAT family N-acetyltransferase [Myxococcaceae bacterium]|nr:GNAT family N-acetyltransferase [Myxococcaceae bacterium]
MLEATVRSERRRILGGLLRSRVSLEAAEDAFQEAVVAAMEAWRSAPPQNPGAWLMNAAKHRLVDAQRRGAVASAKATLLAGEETVRPSTPEAVADDQLRLIFTCCHPSLSLESQLALTLKVVVGSSTAEIARALLTTEDTVSQRILRARQALERLETPYESPGRAELPARVGAVLGVVAALFNEGHVSHQGPLMRLELQAEGLRLARLLADLLPAEPEVFGLLSLICFGAARASARVDSEGLPVLLADQDRRRWDLALIREGLMALQRARTLGGGASFVLQAELAAVHTTAPAWALTNWAAILALYDRLMQVAPSPVVAMNRAVAVAMRDGPEAGLEVLAPLAEPLGRSHHYFAVKAELLDRAGSDPRAVLRTALALVGNEAERRLLERRLLRAEVARLTFREASKADGAAIEALLHEVYVGGGFTDPAAAVTRFAAEAVLSRGTVLLAEHAGTLAGMIVLVPGTSPARQLAEGDEVELHLLAVRERFRASGLGDRLVKAVIERAEGRGIILWTQPTMAPAQRLYERNGFMRVPERDFEKGGRRFLVLVRPR